MGNFCFHLVLSYDENHDELKNNGELETLCTLIRRLFQLFYSNEISLSLKTKTYKLVQYAQIIRFWGNKKCLTLIHEEAKRHITLSYEHMDNIWLNILMSLHSQHIWKETWHGIQSFCSTWSIWVYLDNRMLEKPCPPKTTLVDEVPLFT